MQMSQIEYTLVLCFSWFHIDLWCSPKSGDVEIWGIGFPELEHLLSPEPPLQDVSILWFHLHPKLGARPRMCRSGQSLSCRKSWWGEGEGSDVIPRIVLLQEQVGFSQTFTFCQDLGSPMGGQRGLWGAPWGAHSLLGMSAKCYSGCNCETRCGLQLHFIFFPSCNEPCSVPRRGAQGKACLRKQQQQQHDPGEL